MVQGIFSVLLYLRLDFGRLHNVNFFLFLVLALLSLLLVADRLTVLVPAVSKLVLYGLLGHEVLYVQEVVTLHKKIFNILASENEV